MASQHSQSSQQGQKKANEPHERTIRVKNKQKRDAATGWERFAASRWAFVTLALAALLVYGKTAGFEWVNFDDRIFADNYYMQHWSDIGKAWFGAIFGDFYRPIFFTMIVAENVLFGGNNTFIHHAISTIIHLVNCCLVFVLLAKLSGERPLAFLLAMVFAVHPLLTQATGWVPGRNDSLVAVFVLASMIALVEYADWFNQAQAVEADTQAPHSHAGQVWKSLAAHIGWFAAAMFTKETAIVVPVIGFVYLFSKGLLRKDLHGEGPAQRLPARSVLLLCGLWVVVVAGYLALRIPAVSGAGSGANPFASLSTTWRALPEMMGKMLVPVGLAVHPTFTLYNTAIGLVVLAVLGYSVWWVARGERRALAVLGMVWLLVFLVPPLVYYFDRTEASGVDFKYLEHRAYLPIVGFLLIVAVVARELQVRRVLSSGTVRMMLVGYAVIGAGGALVHLECFRNAYNFWGNVLQTNSQSAKAYNSIGAVLYDVNRPEEAAAYFRKAIAIDPRNVAAWDGLASMYIRMNMFDEAEREVNHAYSIDSTFPNVLYNKAFLTHRHNPNDSATTAAAIALFEKTVKYAPAHGQAYLSLVYFASREGRLADVRRYFNQAAKNGVDTTILRLEINKHLRGAATAW
jgi:Tfp pilus assembly protein PilF